MPGDRLGPGRQVAAPSTDSPCTSRASAIGRSSGRALPATTGTSGRPASSSTLSAFAVTLPRSTLPLTVVTPVRSRPGWPQANTMASASSMPGSQSSRTGAPALAKGPFGQYLPPAAKIVATHRLVFP